MGLRFRAALASIVCVVTLRGAHAQEPEQGDAFDARTRRRLEASELVKSPVEERRGALRLLGGTSMKVIDFAPSAVWRALERAPDLGAMLPAETTVRVTSRRGDERRARVRHRHGVIEASYHVRITYDERAMLLLFRLDPGDGSRLRAGWGFVQISAWPGGRALVRFGALVDVGSGLVTSLMRPTLQRAILDVPRTIERYMVRCTGAAAAERC